MRWGDRRGQSTLEYAALIVIIVAALLGMAGYMKRGAMGKLRESTDSLGTQFTPLGTSTKFTTVVDGARRVTQAEDGTSTEAITAARPEKRNRTGQEHVETPLSGESLF